MNIESMHTPIKDETNLARDRAVAGTVAEPEDAWLSAAHMLCDDHGIAQGNIEDRIDALRCKLNEAREPVAVLFEGGHFIFKEGKTPTDLPRGWRMNVFAMGS